MEWYIDHPGECEHLTYDRTTGKRVPCGATPVRYMTDVDEPRGRKLQLCTKHADQYEAELQDELDRS